MKAVSAAASPSRHLGALSEDKKGAPAKTKANMCPHNTKEYSTTQVQQSDAVHIIHLYVSAPLADNDLAEALRCLNEFSKRGRNPPARARGDCARAP